MYVFKPQVETPDSFRPSRFSQVRLDLRFDENRILNVNLYTSVANLYIGENFDRYINICIVWLTDIQVPNFSLTSKVGFLSITDKIRTLVKV